MIVLPWGMPHDNTETRIESPGRGPRSNQCQQLKTEAGLVAA